MDPSDRTSPKRQVARLIGSSVHPFYALSDDEILVFANESLAQLLKCTVNDLIGMRCSPLSDLSKQPLTVPTFLSLPSNWSRRQFKVVPIEPSFETSHFDWSILRCPEDCKPVKCLIPLDEDGAGCTLCVLACISSEDANLHIALDQEAAVIQAAQMSSVHRFPKLQDIWFLQGKSPTVQRALHQIQVALLSHEPFAIFGPAGSNRTWLAQWIYQKRLASHAETSRSSSRELPHSMVRIECRLMDTDLLQGMLEMIDEQSAAKNNISILIDGLESLTEECASALNTFLAKRPVLQCLTTCIEPSGIDQDFDGSMRNRILLRSNIHRIDLPPLLLRMDDIRTLIAAWLQARPEGSRNALEYSNEFVDALNAYSWPDDVAEFSMAMEQATAHADPAKGLQFDDLPVSIRTCASHIERDDQDDSVDLDAILEDVERTMIMRALERFPRNKTAVAKMLNISRARLIRRLQQWGIQTGSDTADGDDEQPVFHEIQ